MEILRIENLSFTYPSSQKKALDNINICVNGGDFIAVCGESGCGKTTLLKMIKSSLAPSGEKTGAVYYNGTNTEDLDARTAAGEIGFVLQNPESQIVTDKVWHELAFGLENIGMPTEQIRRRVGEMASYFGIGEWYHKSTSELSGGQKQILNLAAVMAMSPKILILDEPTSQLDPIAAADFISTVKKINRELLVTVIIVEHRLEEIFSAADKIIVMEDAGILYYDTPKEICKKLASHKLMYSLPCAARIKNELDTHGEFPVTVREGRDYLTENFTNEIDYLKKDEYAHSQESAVKCKNVWFRYAKDEPDVLKGFDIEIYKNEVFAVLGGNGAGKTTALNVIAGIKKAYRGKIEIAGKKLKDYKNGSLYRHNIALLPQDPQTVFLKSSVSEDFKEICKVMEYSQAEKESMISSVSALLGIEDLLERHPYDLSGGEQQKCALAKLLLLKPQILLLDEPTKGIDSYSKHNLASIIKMLKNEGLTVIFVTHDVEFASQNADRCALFFDGEALSCDTPDNFFSGNNFYTTAASRISRHMFKNTVTAEDVAALCRLNRRKH
ncbi:MAG: ATP-binding cassette domain-containing protein [Clostridia bacterium]|nr:ATP-binding cassette domain-containing protein [Clostridia bacterium]